MGKTLELEEMQEQRQSITANEQNAGHLDSPQECHHCYVDSMLYCDGSVSEDKSRCATEYSEDKDKSQSENSIKETHLSETDTFSTNTSGVNAYCASRLHTNSMLLGVLDALYEHDEMLEDYASDSDDFNDCL